MLLVRLGEMRRQRSAMIVLGMVACGWVASASATLPWVFQFTENALGYADQQGFCSRWWNTDENLLLEDGLELPVAFQFNSNQRHIADGCLGHGWWFPILESTITLAEDRWLLAGPGGYLFSLFPHKDDPSVLKTLDTGLLVRKQPDGDFLVEDKRQGWKFLYQGGRLDSAVTPKGDALTWVREGKRVVRIVSAARGDLLTARYNADTLLEHFELTQTRCSSKFTYTEVPLIQEEGAEPKLAPSIGTLEDSYGFFGYITHRLEPDGKTMRMEEEFIPTRNGKATTGANTLLKVYRWDAATKQIVEAFGKAYEISFPFPYPGAHAKIIQKDPEGSIASYCHDIRAGYLEETRTDGTESKTWFVTERGPAHGKVARRVEENVNRRRHSEYKAAYDQLGRVESEFIDGSEVKYAYDPGAKDIYRHTERLENKADGSSKLAYYVEGKLTKAEARSKSGRSEIIYYNDDGDDVRHEYPDGAWRAIEYYKRGLPSKITSSSGRIDVFNYDADGKLITKWINGSLVWRRVKSSGGREYALTFAENEPDPFHVRAVIDLETGRALRDKEAKVIISECLPQ
jgi:hypothetical protein